MDRNIKYAWLLFLFVAVSCTKESAELPMPDPVERERSSEGKLRDSTFYYTYYYYLWQNELPDRFPTDRYKTAEDVLEALKSYAKDPSGSPYDRFSFLDRTGTINAEIQQGQVGDFGFDVRYGFNDLLFIKKVIPGSPADRLGLKRGNQILEINGVRDLSYEAMEKDDFNFLMRSLTSSSIGMRIAESVNGPVRAVTVTSGSYQYNPILSKKVFNLEGKKVGYFALDMFISTITNNNRPSYVQQLLDEVNTEFEAQGVKEVIVDLRYNGGGAVITADYITNMLAPNRANNELMYSYRINSTLELQGWGNTVFTPEYIRKTNQLDLDHLYFIVTGSTASASELLINNLKPYIPVTLFGENKTYGKPVGYFAWDIMGADLYAVSFQTINAAGYGDYFAGIPVDYVIGEDILYDFGDSKENMLDEVLFYIQNGRPFQARPYTNSLLAIKGNKLNVLVEDKNRILDNRGRNNMYLLNKNKK
jgi:carboxyl-terminal processing protease